MNAHGWNVYVSVNAYRPGRSRAREAVAHVRHLFLEEDLDGPGLLAALSTRPDLPPPSYVLHSSPGRLHVLWRVRDIAPSRVEQLQKQLARELLDGSGRNVVRADHEVAGILQSQATAIGSRRHRVPPLARRLRGEGSASRRRRDNAIEHARRRGDRCRPRARWSEHAHFSSASIPLSPDSRAICGRFVFAVESCADLISQTTRRCAR